MCLDLSYFQKMRRIILPQAIRQMLAPLASVICVQELTHRANELKIREYRLTARQ